MCMLKEFKEIYVSYVDTCIASEHNERREPMMVTRLTCYLVTQIKKDRKIGLVN